MSEQQEKLSSCQIAIYAEKYIKMRNRSVETFLDCHITRAKNIRQYELRNNDLLAKWKSQVQKESGILFFPGMNDVSLNCLRYLAMREESCWHTAREERVTDLGVKVARLVLNSTESIKKSKQQFDCLADNFRFYHGSE